MTRCRDCALYDLRAVLSANGRVLTNPVAEEVWTEWSGGECPVDPDVFVFPKFRGEPDPSKGMLRTYGRAWQYAWHHDGAEDDIIAYRPEPKP